MERLDAAYREITELCQCADLAVIEGLAFASHTPSALERAGLWWMIARWLWKRNIRMQTVAPTAAKKFCTGSGKGEKNLILREVWKRWQVDAANDNEADAYILLRIGLVLAGVAEPDTEPEREVIAALTGGRVKKLPTPKHAKGTGQQPAPLERICDALTTEHQKQSTAIR